MRATRAAAVRTLSLRCKRAGLGNGGGRRAAGGWAEYLRSLSLVFVVAPFVEPLLSGAAISVELAALGVAAGIALSSMLDLEKRD